MNLIGRGAERASTVRRDLSDAWVYRRAVRRLPACGAARVAVVVHVYYGEVWPELEERIGCISEPVDIIVTVPVGAPLSIAQRRRLERAALILDVPNRGRDVLPFLELLAPLRRAGYEQVLKLHTKRSVHSPIGDTWREHLVDDLLHDPRQVGQVLHILREGAGLVGPAGSYYPLDAAFEQNVQLVARVLFRELGSEAVERIVAGRLSRGFFAGSMYWADLRTLSRALPKVPLRFYAPERGQVNGTMAHAMERIVTIMLEESGHPVYGVRGGSAVVPAGELPIVTPEWYQQPGGHLP